jgi:hypothetical protein
MKRVVGLWEYADLSAVAAMTMPGSAGFKRRNPNAPGHANNVLTKLSDHRFACSLPVPFTTQRQTDASIERTMVPRSLGQSTSSVTPEAAHTNSYSGFVFVFFCFFRFFI